MVFNAIKYGRKDDENILKANLMQIFVTFDMEPTENRSHNDLSVNRNRNVFLITLYTPVSWGCRIHQLHLHIRVRPPTNKYPIYDIKQSDGDDPKLGI